MRDRAEALDRAYRRTRYRILLPGAVIERRIGRADPRADAQLRSAGCQRDWALVTAWNPRSESCGEAANRERQAGLQRQLEQRGQPYLPARHCSPAGDWPDEESVCLIDPPEGLAAALGQAWEQDAVVTGRLGAAPQLLWLRDAAP